MKKLAWALCAVGLWGCGEAGSLPDGKTPAGECTGECAAPPGLSPQAPVAALPSTLWPLTTGSTWTYQITADTRGVFEKTVTVEGPREVPDAVGEAISVLSVEPYKSERSWQLTGNGLAYRVREEDLTDGALTTVTTWDPATIKNLVDPQPVGWSSSSTIHELERVMADGTVKEKDRTYVWTVLAVDESVTVPAGTFQALKVQRSRPDKTDKVRTYWLVPGVGKVREDGERLEELVRYEVKPLQSP